MGGEKNLVRFYPLCFPGSPPHGRGKALPLYVVVLNLGITPAWAGKSDIYETLGTDPEDHPRMGGEKRPA